MKWREKNGLMEAEKRAEEEQQKLRQGGVQRMQVLGQAVGAAVGGCASSLLGSETK